jgi:hypothetical protein
MDRTNILLADMRHAAEADLATRLGVKKSGPAPGSCNLQRSVETDRGRSGLASPPTFPSEEKR